MSAVFDAERLLSLLPAIYRVRDEAEGGPLRALLAVIAREMAVIEEDLAQLYDDQFVETAAEWALPYIADLLGARPLAPIPSGAFSQRAYVANTLAYRRRKGTASVLEQLARDVTGWDARVVEFFQLLATTQHVNHPRTMGLETPRTSKRNPTPLERNAATPDLRAWEPLERVGTAFDTFTRTVDVRRIATGHGRYNIPNVGVFVWRLPAYSHTNVPPGQPFGPDDWRRTFSPLAANTRLVTRPAPEEAITGLATPLNVPTPMSRRVLAEDLILDGEDEASVLYGEGRSLLLTARWTTEAGETLDPRAVAGVRVRACDLSDAVDAAGQATWGRATMDDHVAVDPVLGRIVLPPDWSEPEPEFEPGLTGTKDLLVTFHTAFSADMGGGEYERPSVALVRATPLEDLATALVGNTLDATVQIEDGGRWERGNDLIISPPAGGRLEVRAKNGVRPTFVLAEDRQILVTGTAGSTVVLDGLLIAGPIAVGGALAGLRISHCTLVPGLRLTLDGAPLHPVTPSLTLDSSFSGTAIEIEIDHSITGPLLLPATGCRLTVRDSIIDSPIRPGDAAEEPAIAAIAGNTDGSEPGPATTIERSTVIGRVEVRQLDLASDTIFTGPVRAERLQTGCVRYSAVPPGSRTPRRYECVPPEEPAAGTPSPRPSFRSLRYGDAAYCQLGPGTPAAIRTGASDEAEMGAFHDLYQPQREGNLRDRFDDYLRFGLEAGIIDGM